MRISSYVLTHLVFTITLWSWHYDNLHFCRERYWNRSIMKYLTIRAILKSAICWLENLMKKLNISSFIVFNWRKIALQCCIGFCIQENKSAIIIHIPRSSWASLPSPYPAHLDHQRVPVSAPCVIQELLTTYLIYTR